MKKVVITILCVAMIFMLAACSSKTLNGTYTSESGKYTVVFKNDGTCIWKQDILGTETFFDGTYEKDENGYTLYIRSNLKWVSNTTFVATPVNGGLQITGGVVYGEIFRKK